MKKRLFLTTCAMAFTIMLNAQQLFVGSYNIRNHNSGDETPAFTLSTDDIFHIYKINHYYSGQISKPKLSACLYGSLRIDFQHVLIHISA